MRLVVGFTATPQGQSSTGTVATTLSVLASITETLALFELAT
jgi:hypothetical protein